MLKMTRIGGVPEALVSALSTTEKRRKMGAGCQATSLCHVELSRTSMRNVKVGRIVSLTMKTSLMWAEHCGAATVPSNAAGKGAAGGKQSWLSYIRQRDLGAAS